MDEQRSWLRSHWRTAVALALLFALAMFLRFYFVYGSAFVYLGWTCDGGSNLPVSGGSDSYYWHRALCYSFETGKELRFDTQLNFPLGMFNPRPPLYSWFSLLVGRLIAPLFGSPWSAVQYVFLASTGLWGALTVFPTYLLARDAFGRRAGLLAALLVAVSAAHMQRSPATNADHDALTLFFVVTTFYFFLRAFKTLQSRRWVGEWSKVRDIRTGVAAFVRENRPALLYAVLTGLCITVIALSWQGWAYVPVILLVFFLVQLFMHRVRNEDPMGLTALVMVALLVPLVLAFPWYQAHQQIRTWFDVPAYLFGAAFVLGVALTVTRDYPWTLVIPGVVVAAAAAFGVGVLVNPGLADALVSGAGYFVPSKVYRTIAEAQAPGISQVNLAFGWFSFYFSLAAVAYMVWLLPKRHDPAYTLIVIWAFAAIFMAMAAARFIFNASPAFAVAAAFALDLIITRADFGTLRRTYRSLSAGSWRNAVRKSVKLRHGVVVVLLVSLILLPNVWFGVDAGMPFEVKPYYNEQVQSMLPPFLRAPGASAGGPTLFYFGAFGFTVPTLKQYYPAAWQWFRTQDLARLPEARPAYLSWWDYGFEAVDRGQHPTVADNFQNGVQFAGQFITAQSEDASIVLLALRVMEGNVRANRGAFSPAVQAVLAEYGLPAQDYLNAFLQPAALIPVVEGDPVLYGAWAADMQAFNAMWIYLSTQTLLRIQGDQVVDFYHDMRAATGSDIRYFAVDARLFPISATNTGIFYAPVTLADHRVVVLPDGRVIPVEFYQILVDTSAGSGIPIQDVPPGEPTQNPRLEYLQHFYESIFYRAYIGYSPTDLGLPDDHTIPGFSPSLANFPPVPAWNLSHFRVVYRTAYYNPFEDAANHTEAFVAMNYDEAQRIQKEIEQGTRTGVVDLRTQAAVTNGVVFVQYYDGAVVRGSVLAAGTSPVPDVRITVTDELGTPHYLTTTDAQGRFTAIVPFGNVTLTASVGPLSRTTLIGSTVLGTETFPVTVAQAMREGTDSDGDGTPDWMIVRDIRIPGGQAIGTAYFDLNGDGVLDPGDEVVPGASLTFTHTTIGFTRETVTDTEGGYALPPVPSGPYRVQATVSGRDISLSDVDLGTQVRHDLSIPFTSLAGFAVTSDGSFVPGASIDVEDLEDGTTTRGTTSDAGFYRIRPLLPGNYSVTAGAGDLQANPARIHATSGQIGLNFTLLPSGRVAGTTRVLGTIQPFATLEFQLTSDPGFVRSLTSNALGAFTIALPAGEWNVNGRMYVGATLYALLGRVRVRPGETTSLAATFVEGVRIEGAVNGTAQDGPNAVASIAFLAGGAEWWLRTGVRGGYLAFLPRGTYSLQAFTPNSAYYESITFDASRRFDLQLVEGAVAPLVVYRDRNRDGAVDGDEPVPGASVRLADERGRVVFGATDAAGSVTLHGFANRTYLGAVEAAGFAVHPLGPGSLADIRRASPIALVARPIEVRGSVVLDGTPVVNRPLTVQARPLGAGARGLTTTTDSNGGYFLSLEPGFYELVVDENVSGSADERFQNARTEEITVPIDGRAMTVDLAIVVRVRITGLVTRNGTAVNASLDFDGPDPRSVSAGPSGYQVYLRTGLYSISASATPPDAYAFLDARDIVGPGNQTLALEPAARVSGRTLYQGSVVSAALPILFERTGGGTLDRESAGGAYLVTLPAGTYSVRVDATTSETEAGVPRFYRYAFSGTLVVPAGASTTTFDLDLSRALDNTTVSGMVRSGVQTVDASIRFYARGGGAIGAVASATAGGGFSVPLAPGQYDVYATRAAGNLAFLGSVVVPHASAFPMDIRIAQGYVLAGIVTDAQGARAVADLVFLAGARVELRTDPSGSYEALLPPGTYEVTAERRGVEQGVPVTYRADATVNLASDGFQNFVLRKVEAPSVSLTWDPGQRQSVAPGGSVTYSFRVRNTGNIADTYRFSGLPSGWTFTFSPSQLSLDFGTAGNEATVSVTIRTPPDALVAHGPVTLLATSSNGVTQGSVNVEVDVLRERGVGVEILADSGVFDRTFLNYTVEVQNAGNGDELVTVLIANPSDLAASGWSVALVREDGSGPTGIRLEDIPVGANATVRLRLRLQSPTGPSGVPVVIETFIQADPAVEASTVQTVVLPQLTAPSGIQASGPHVVRTATLNPLFLAIPIAAAVAVALGLVLTRRRR